VMQRLIQEKKGTVYATSTILGLIMAAPRSVDSWDIVVTVRNGAIFLDKRLNSRIDYLGVNENWNESQEQELESANHTRNLTVEATFVDHNFSEMVVRKGKKSEAIGEAHPFLNAVPMGQEPASTAYQYRKWDLGDNIKVVARCEVHGHETRKGKKTTFLSRAITEWDSKLAGNMDYRQKLESQSGAVLASEMKNNKNKLTRWTAEALISGVDEFKLGFVSRVNSKNNYEHDVLLVQRFKPTDFANMMQVERRHSGARSKPFWRCSNL